MPSLTPPIPGTANDPNRPFGVSRRLYENPIGFGFELSDEDMVNILGSSRGLPRPALRRSGSIRERQLFRQQERQVEQDLSTLGRQIAFENALSIQQREEQLQQTQQQAQTPRQRSEFYQILRNSILAEEGAAVDRSREGMIFDPNYSYENIVGQQELTPGQRFGPQPGWIPFIPRTLP